MNRRRREMIDIAEEKLLDEANETGRGSSKIVPISSERGCDGAADDSLKRTQ